MNAALASAEIRESSRGSNLLSRAHLWAAALSFAVALAVYFLTAYRTITWWNNAEEAVAASDLGVMSAPGGVISTILGWLVIHLLPVASEIVVLNVFAGVLAGLAVAGVLLLAYRIERLTSTHGAVRHIDHLTLFWCGAITAALCFGFGETLWTYAVQYTTYIVTPVFTVLMIFAMLKWW